MESIKAARKVQIFCEESRSPGKSDFTQIYYHFGNNLQMSNNAENFIKDCLLQPQGGADD